MCLFARCHVMSCDMLYVMRCDVLCCYEMWCRVMRCDLMWCHVNVIWCEVMWCNRMGWDAMWLWSGVVVWRGWLWGHAMWCDVLVWCGELGDDVHSNAGWNPGNHNKTTKSPWHSSIVTPYLRWQVSTPKHGSFSATLLSAPLSPRISGTKNGGTEPYKAIFWDGFSPT